MNLSGQPALFSVFCITHHRSCLYSYIHLIGEKCFAIIDDGSGTLRIFLDKVDSIDLGFNGRQPKKTLHQSRIGVSVFALDEKKRLLALCAVLDVSPLRVLRSVTSK